MRLTIKYFTDLTNLNPSRPAKLIPLLSWQSGSVSDATPSDRITRTTDVSAADLVIAPRVWGSYVSARDLTEPNALAAIAKRAGKPFLVWHTGDLSPLITDPDWIVLVNGLDRSRRKPNWFVAPHFIDDPMTTYQRQASSTPEKPAKPRVGFCGYASSSFVKLAYSVGQNLQFRILYAVGRKAYEPPPLIPSTLLRGKVLARLRAHGGVQTDFILRTKYRTGSTADFYRNILETDYTVCVRGYGNWSVRLYETLACGRIPVFIDTDCGLPFDNRIDWRQYSVWIPETDVAHAAEHVVEFHDRLSGHQLRDLQRECRRLWETRLSHKGFLDHLSESIPLF